MVGKKKTSADPLFQLFEHYLLNRSYEDSAAFTKEVSEEYVTYLDSTSAHVPFHVRKTMMEDLEAEAHELLVKKMYGCVKDTEHANYGKVMRMEKGKLKTFDYTPPALSPMAETPSAKSIEEAFKEEPPSAFQKSGSRVR